MRIPRKQTARTHGGSYVRVCCLLVCLGFVAAPIEVCRRTEKALPPQVADGTSAYVDKITDGDTFVARVGGDKVVIRVLGIDCPESHRNPKCRSEGEKGGPDCEQQIPFGLEAARRAAVLMKHQVVTLENPTSRDRNGRTLAYVRLSDGQDYGKLMIREGLCKDFGWKYPHPRMHEYLGE